MFLIELGFDLDGLNYGFEPRFDGADIGSVGLPVSCKLIFRGRPGVGVDVGAQDQTGQQQEAETGLKGGFVHSALLAE
ncbi:hypothetical protein PMHK_29630 [Pseudomonas sp. MHK4]